MPKPADFYLGVTVLLGVVVPGALLALILMPSKDDVFGTHGLFPSIPGAQAGAWIAFAVAAYLLGQIAYTLGSLISEPFEDTWEKLPMFRPKTSASLASLRKEASKLANELGIESRETLAARDYVRINSPAAFLASERMESEYKLFRSLAVVLAIGALVSHSWPTSLIEFVLAVVVWWLFLMRRIQRLEADFRFFVLLRGNHAVPPGDEKPHAHG